MLRDNLCYFCGAAEHLCWCEVGFLQLSCSPFFLRNEVARLTVCHSQVFQRCWVIMFSMWASLPQQTVIMWCGWILSRAQIYAPLAGEYASIMTRVSGRRLANSPSNCSSRSIICREEREECCLWIRDQRDVNSYSRCAGGPLDLKRDESLD